MKDDKKSRIVTYILLAFIFVFLLWSGSWYFIYVKLNCWENRAAFGDMFGAVNALFSGFAFAGVLITLALQSKELQYQRLELEQTREELKGQKEQLFNQNETFKKQNFENTFFHLLELQIDIVNSIDFQKGTSRGTTTITKGRDCFVTFYDRFKKAYESERDIKSAFRKFYDSNHFNLSHYFRSTKRIFEFIDESTVDNKDIYLKTVISQFSDQELLLLFYYCRSDICETSFKQLVENYSILHDVPSALLI